MELNIFFLNFIDDYTLQYEPAFKIKASQTKPGVGQHRKIDYQNSFFNIFIL